MLMETTMKTSYQHDYIHDNDENNISQNLEIIDSKYDLDSTPTTIKVVISEHLIIKFTIDHKTCQTVTGEIKRLHHQRKLIK